MNHRRRFFVTAWILSLFFISSGPETGWSKTFYIGTRIWPAVTQEQLDFINAHFDLVLTAMLQDEVRQKIQGPRLLLYRSIQGTWTDYTAFDWQLITAQENMFLHSTDPLNTNPNQRIKTIWDSWLMDGNDLVEASDPQALTHWINYYAETASHQVETYGYDGLFIDSAGHRLWTGVVDFMPDGYTAESWRDGRYAALAFIKSYLPNQLVIFNGLHSGNGAEASLLLTGGGMWETFAFDPATGTYYGEAAWLEAIALIARNYSQSIISLVAKKPGLIEDPSSRVFLAASYLLVSHPHVILTLTDNSYPELTTSYYYPEYDLDLGSPVGEYTLTASGLYERVFTKGKVWVNPSATASREATLGQPFWQVIPHGGGLVLANGQMDGWLEYVPASGTVSLPPVSGLICLNQRPTPGSIQTPTCTVTPGSFDRGIAAVYPNPTRNEVFFHLPTGTHGPVDIRLYTVQGKLAAKWSTEEPADPVRMDVSVLAPGIYFYLIFQAGQRLGLGKLAIVR